MRILNVDDDANNRYLIETLMRAQAHEVTSARNGREALDELDKESFDLIVSDVLMPEMDGFQLCHEVRTRERTRSIPFIIYTATYTSRRDEALGLALGASRFVVKPVEPERFIAIVEEVLREAQQAGNRAANLELKDPVEYLKAYTERLVQKLDRKIAQLEAEIVQRKRAEEERSRLEVQFLQSQKLESIGRLAGGVAHDFNNLLTVINGYSEILAQQIPGTGPIQNAVREIRKAGERASELTRQLLLFSRRHVPQLRPLNLNRAVTETRDMIERLLGDDITVAADLASPLPPVMADEGQIHQVLLNLVVNARDAMPAGGRLTIETRAVTITGEESARMGDIPPGPYVLLAVTDTGAGMDTETLQRAFEPFFTTKAEGSGTGLGLSTVYGIVNQSGGRIHVESEPGRGASFRIYLPEAVASPHAHDGPAAGAAPGGSETVLVVDDHDSVRSLIMGILQSRGYTVLSAAGGDEALKLVATRSGNIDLLVTDVQMPNMSGPELAARLRERCPSLQVLYASGCAEDTALAGAGAAWIGKPFLPAELANKVRELLGSSGATREATGDS